MNGEDALNSAGKAILYYADYRVCNLLGFMIILVAVIIHKRKNGAWPERDDVVRAAIGILMVSTAITVFCVFFLTKPPYIAALSSEGIGVSAFITFIFMCGLGLSEVKRLLDPRPSSPTTDPSKPLSTGNASIPPKSDIEKKHPPDSNLT